jgi:glycosyltransferase involved in cell wall biosynthesis
MKLKVVRVVTASYVVPWHLNNTLKRMPDDFSVCVAGQDVSVNQEDYPNVTFTDININRKASVFADVKALFALCRFVYWYKPDIVHSIMPKAGLLAALAGFICRVPIRIHTFTGQTWVAKKGASRYLFYMFDLLVNSINTVCLTDSFSQSAFLAEHHITHAGQPLPVLSKGSLSGVELKRFNFKSLAERSARLRSSLGIGVDDFVFSYIARKTQAKGAIDTLKAFSVVSASFQKTRLLFVGPDEDGEIAQLRNSNPEFFDNVCDIGHVHDHELYLAITDVLCLPSYREGFGSIVIDAAAMGVPTIGSRIPGLTDSIVDNETGLLFTPGDIDELVNLMTRFIENLEMRKIMGENAKARVDEFFTADRLYESLKQFYLDCVSAKLGTRTKAGRSS